MSDRIEQRLEQALAYRAAVISPPRFTADDLIATARITRARRRAAIIRAGVAVAVAIGVAAVLTSNGLFWLAVTDDAGPAQSAAPPHYPSPAEVGLDVIVDGRLIPHDAAPFELDLPAGEQPMQATRTPDGWVVATYQEDPGGSSLWFVRAGGSATRIGKLSNAFAVSSDGRTLVAGGTIKPDSVAAYRLPTLQLLGSRRAIAGSVPVGLFGDQVLYEEVSGDLGPTTAHAWNFETGQLSQTNTPVNLWGMTTGGLVLQRVLTSSGASGDARTGCVQMASIEALNSAGSQYCGVELGDPEMTGLMSPDGAWVAFGLFDDPPVLVRVADLRNRRWRPVPTNLPPSTVPVFWAGSTLVVGDRGTNRYFACRPPEPCLPITVPGSPGGRVVLVPSASN